MVKRRYLVFWSSYVSPVYVSKQSIWLPTSAAYIVSCLEIHTKCPPVLRGAKERYIGKVVIVTTAAP